MARTRRKASTVVITCAAPGCTRRVRRRRGTRYCSPSCRQEAYRARVDRRQANARRAQIKLERDRLKALDVAKAKALAQLSKREIRELLAAGGNYKDGLRGSYRRERAALRAADTAADLGRIRLDGEAERSPLLEAASRLPPKRPRMKATPSRLAEVAGRKQRGQRQPKQKLRKSPLQGGSLEGTRKQTRPGVVVVRRGRGA